MSQAVSGIGTKFRRKTNSVYEDIAEIVKIAGPDMKRNTIDVTSLDSVGGYAEFIAGMKDGGSYKLDMIFRRDMYDLMKADFESDELNDYEVLLPDLDGTSINFQGLVVDLGMDVPKDKEISSSVTIKISGEVIIQSGSAVSSAVLP